MFKNQMHDIDTQHAVEIANRVWWVGHYLPGDKFQCHVYLIENGNESVLIDPGSQLTFDGTLRKIEEVMPFSQIRYFICHHQDPDIAGAMSLVEQKIEREDCLLITHWRVAALLKHYALITPFWLIEENGWKLELGSRTLQFIFTPYLHFPGAFCTFDNSSKMLFSSDLFGAFTEDWSLFAEDESHFENIRPFHEHYMPSREIMLHALLEIERYPISMIAPQHGSIIKGRLVNYMIEKLKGLECGLYLINKDVEDVQRLSNINQTLRDIMSLMVIYRKFSDIASPLLELSQRLLPVERLEFFVLLENKQVLHLTPLTHYRGDVIPSPSFCEGIWQLDQKDMQKNYLECNEKTTDRFMASFVDQDCEFLEVERGYLLVPLFSSREHGPQALGVFHLSEDVEISVELDQMIGQLSVPLAVATEREAIYRMIELERDKMYERSIRDPLTSLYTRSYMQDSVQRLLSIHNRDAWANIVLVICDIDHFKHINDTYGHVIGDKVLKAVGSVLLGEIRSTDIPVRYGGEEFAIFMPMQTVEAGVQFAERLRQKIEKIKFLSTDKKKRFSVTISVGVASHQQKESLQKLIQRADEKMYQAKDSGRNKVCVASVDKSKIEQKIASKEKVVSA